MTCQHVADNAGGHRKNDDGQAGVNTVSSQKGAVAAGDHARDESGQWTTEETGDRDDGCPKVENDATGKLNGHDHGDDGAEAHDQGEIQLAALSGFVFEPQVQSLPAEDRERHNGEISYQLLPQTHAR